MNIDINDEELEKLAKVLMIIEVLERQELFYKTSLINNIEKMLDLDVPWSSIKRITNITQGQYKRMRKTWGKNWDSYVEDLKAKFNSFKNHETDSSSSSIMENTHD